LIKTSKSIYCPDRYQPIGKGSKEVDVKAKNELKILEVLAVERGLLVEKETPRRWGRLDSQDILVIVVRF